MQQKQKTKRQLVEDARQAALDGRWDEALSMNEQLIERYPRDAEAHNRLGRALVAYKRYGAAFDAYTAALKADPANMIARRNLQRLEHLRLAPEPETTTAEPAEGNEIPRTAVFIEEIGKTWIDELVNPAPAEELAKINAGEQLQFRIEGDRLLVVTPAGQRLGEVEAKTAERVIELMEGGNRYEVYALGLSAHSLRVILREVYHDPAMAGKVAFPRQLKATRAYMRERDILLQRDQEDFFHEDEDEGEEDEEAALESEEEEEGPESDAEAFIEDTVTVDEDEPQI